MNMVVNNLEIIYFIILLIEIFNKLLFSRYVNSHSNVR